MPRRKRTTGQNERRKKVRRRDNNNEEEDEDNTLVISDSESDEEEEDCAMAMTTRTARRIEREKKAHVQDMTEEEMLDLALRLSKQEANSATQREQVDDDNMRKAIAESLQVSCSKSPERSSKRTRSVAKPHQDRDTVSAHVRCKLSFPNEDEKDGVNDDEDPKAQSALKGPEEDGPLPPMPDLSQRSLSQPSPPSPTLPSVPSAASQECRSSHLAKQEFNAHCPEGASSQSDSPLKKSPIFLRHCSVRLNQNLLSASRSSRNSPHTTNSSLSLTSPDKSQNSPPPPKSPVFPKTDLKSCTKSTRDCTSHSSYTDSVRKPEDTFQESSSHKCRDSPRRLSRSRKAQTSSQASVSEDDKQEAGKVQQTKEETSRGTGLSTVSDTAPNMDASSPADACRLDEYVSHMILLLSDDDDDDNNDDDEENDKIIPPSPVFPQDRASCTGKPKLSPTQRCFSSPTATQDHTKSSSQAQSEQPNVSKKSADSRLAPAAEGKDVSVVSYYWGVPFCPKGQSPDDYTQVILTQLEVYEKSLKEAQRQLLHKADWGLPVFPCPVERPHSRRLKRHRAPQLLDDEEEEEEEEDEGRDEDGKEKKKKVAQKEREASQSCSEEAAEDGQHETYVVVSSPEPQEERGKSPLLLKQKEPTNTAKPSSCRKPISQDLSEDTQIQSEPDDPGEEAQNGSFDVENAVCPETQMTEDNTPELMVTSPSQLQPDIDVMEVDEVTDPPPEAEERMEQERPGEEQSWRESVPSQVECPMCTRFFPLCKIEVHAAYCNGTVEEQEQEQQDNISGSARRKGSRKPAMEDNVRFEKSEQREKCFLCTKFFTSKEYNHHVEQCLQQKTLGPKQGNGLLSALNRTETLHLDDSGAGPSNTSNKNKRSLVDTSVTPGDSSDSQASAIYISSSPIKSFTPISEIKDCLINFQQQYSDRTSQRLGRKRKFKR
ncbi:BRCA1-A complex subunit RAP80 isoform X3 [Hemibagrus wyckioides]|uniref:BRCA1-A complex subunit RAP80 isoform X3 n=1 Tax=Hemibagrus wyckioides TaxID=337641 RepID=UPI00266BD943|nr:BRCA1-A complex subunit RAP80 isoform X3 [Hemibagrus wyckioides]